MLMVQFVILFTLFFSILNLPAYYQRINYFYQTKIRHQTFTRPSLINVNQVIRLVRALPTVDTLPDNPRPDVAAETLPVLPDNRLYIPKIDVDVPIIWQVDPVAMVDKLRDGVAHYSGTSLPGQNGNVVITGHSSNFWWDPGQYKQVFVLLDQLKNNDQVVVTYNNQTFIYEVEKIYVVDPGRIEILNPSDHSILTLLTCTPVGTTINRLIVQAKQIHPIVGAVENLPPVPPLLKELPAVR